MTGIEELTWDQFQAEGFRGFVPGGVVLSNQVAGALGRRAAGAVAGGEPPTRPRTPSTAARPLAVTQALGRGILLAEALQNDGPAEWSHAMLCSGPGPGLPEVAGRRPSTSDRGSAAPRTLRQRRHADGGRCISQGWRIREISLRDYTGAYLKAFTPPYPPERLQALVSQMRRHLGRPYDVPGILGQLLTSLTGNAWFARAIETPWLTYCSEFVCQEFRRHLDPDYLLGHRTCQVTPDAMDLWMTAAGWESRTVRLVT